MFKYSLILISVAGINHSDYHREDQIIENLHNYKINKLYTPQSYT